MSFTQRDMENYTGLERDIVENPSAFIGNVDMTPINLTELSMCLTFMAHKEMCTILSKYGVEKTIEVFLDYGAGDKAIQEFGHEWARTHCCKNPFTVEVITKVREKYKTRSGVSV